jgi:hypothetical protein
VEFNVLAVLLEGYRLELHHLVELLRLLARLWRDVLLALPVWIPLNTLI